MKARQRRRTIKECKWARKKKRELRGETYFSYHVGRNRCQILEEEIQYFQCTGRKIQIVTKKGAGDAFYGSMTEVEKLVSVDKFWHIHKSYLVNRNYISSFQPMEVCLTDGTKLPISRNCREEIRQKVLEKMIGSVK